MANSKKDISLGSSSIYKTELYDYQKAIVTEIEKALNSGTDKVCLAAATSAGKTVISAHTIKALVDQGKKVLFLVDQVNLSDQTFDRFETLFDLECGALGVNHDRHDLSKPVLIGTAQTLASYYRRDRAMPEVDVLYIDECHMNYRSTSLLINEQSPIVIGMTATPFTKGMDKLYGKMVQGEHLSKLIESGHISSYKVFSHEKPDLTGLSVGIDGDYLKSDDRYDDEYILNIIKTWDEKGLSDKKTIVFCSSIKQCERVCEFFIDGGYDAQFAHSKIKAKEVVDDFINSKFKVLVSVAMIIKGFDCSDILCAIDISPTQSETKHCQKVGRLIRRSLETVEAQRKQNMIAPIVTYLDFAGNFMRDGLGRPEDNFYTGFVTEEDASKKKKQSTNKECPMCSQLVARSTQVCSCEYEFPKAVDDVEINAGELVDFDLAFAEKQEAEKESVEVVNAIVNFWKTGNKLKKSKGWNEYKKTWIKHQHNNILGFMPKPSHVNAAISSEFNARLDYVELAINESKKAYAAKMKKSG